MPGATFRYNESGGWCEVTNVTMRNAESLKPALAAALAQSLRRWHAIGPADFPDPEAQPGKYVVGEPFGIHYSVWPTVFTCRNCGQVHFYSDLERLRSFNDRMGCRTCKGQSMLRQVPYAYICECGRKESLYIQKHDNSHVIVLVNKNRFEDSYWWCKTCHTALQRNSREGLGFRSCTCAPRKGKRGIVLQDSRIYYSQTLEMVEVESGILAKWASNPRFSDFLLAGVLVAAAYRPSHMLDLATWSASSTGADALTPELRAMRDLMISGGVSQAEADSMAHKAMEAAGQDPWVTYDECLEAVPHLRARDWRASRQTVEYLFVRDEPSMVSVSLDQLIAEHLAIGDEVSTARLESERVLALDLGLVDLAVIEELPTFLGGYGFTRWFPTPQADEDGGDGAHTPSTLALKAFPDQDGKIPIYAAKNTTEAFMYRLDPWRLAAFLSANRITMPQPAEIQTEANLRALLLQLGAPLVELGESHFVRTPFELEAGLQTDAASALMFAVLHSVSHALKATAHRYVGMDGDSLAEYLFPAHSAGLMYVSSHVDFTLGGIDSVFRGNLTQWLGSVRDYAGQCSFDPVCSHSGGACSACLYPKFGCTYFNRTVSRSFLFGGRVSGLDVPVVGFWEHRVSELAGLFRGSSSPAGS